MRKRLVFSIIGLLLAASAALGGSPSVLKSTYKVIDGKFYSVRVLASPSPDPLTTFINSRGLRVDGAGTLYAITPAMAAPPTLINSILGVAIDSNGYIIVDVSGGAGGMVWPTVPGITSWQSGTAWGTTYLTSGSGTTLCLTTACVMTSPVITALSLGSAPSPITETFVVGTGGVTQNTLVATDASNPSKIVAATSGGYGIAQSTVSAAGSVEVARYGTANCVTDTGGATAGHLVIGGSVAAIDCKDSGQTSSSAIPIATRIIGVFRTTATAGNSALVELTPAHFGTQVTAGANTALSNLSGVAINASLLPGADNSIDLGSASFSWRNFYITGQIFFLGSGLLSISGTPGACGTAAANLGQLCLSSTGNRFVYSYNTGTNLPLALGPASAVAHHLVGFLDSTGSVLEDTGIVPTNIVNVASSPLVISGHTVSCPTCAIAENTLTIGGIIGSVQNGQTTGSTSVWLASGSGNTHQAFGADLYLTNLTGVIRGSMSAGSVWQVNQQGFNAFTAFNLLPSFTIPPSAAAGVYQTTSAPPIYIPAYSITALDFNPISPANATVGSLNSITANVVGAAIQPLGVGLAGNTVAGSATVFSGPSQLTTPNATEALMFVPFPYASTLSGLCVDIKGAQPAGGSLVVTVRKATSAGSYAPASTSLVATVPISGGIGNYCDTTDTVSVAATDVIDFQVVNNSGSTSATLNSITLISTVPNGQTGMIIWGTGAVTMASSSSLYVNAFAEIGGATATEANTQFGMPRAVTGSNLNCYVTTAPLTNANVLTVRQNTASPASGLTISIALLATGLVQDVTHTITFANKDLVSLQDTQAAGTAPAISACSMAVN